MIGIVYGALLAIGQTRHHAADRLHLGLALRLHRARHLRVHQPGPVRLDALHGQPRLLDRRAVPRRRLPDQPARLAADRRLRRRREGRAGAGRHRSWSPACPAWRCPGCRRSSASSWCWSGTFTALPGGRASIATLGIVLAALYILLDVPAHDDRPGAPRASRACRDLNAREVWVVAPLLVADHRARLLSRSRCSTSSTRPSTRTMQPGRRAPTRRRPCPPARAAEGAPP